MIRAMGEKIEQGRGFRSSGDSEDCFEILNRILREVPTFKNICLKAFFILALITEMSFLMLKKILTPLLESSVH